MNRKAILSLAFVGLLAATGCTRGKVTGGGQVVDKEGTQIANFGFNADSCVTGPESPEGHFNWVDTKSGVKMNGPLTRMENCLASKSKICSNCRDYFGTNTYTMEVAYRSTNPKYPGEGIAYACVKDNGEGKEVDPGDLVWVLVDDDPSVGGPYSGYSVIGLVQGNIQKHTCDEDDEG